MGDGPVGRKVSEKLYNIFPELLYAVDRNATPAWGLNGAIKSHNLMLIYDGRAEFVCGGEVKTAGARDLIYYRPGDRRAARTTAQAPLKCFAVNFDYLCPFFEDGKWAAVTPPLPFGFYQRLTDDYLYNRVIHLFATLTQSALTGADRAGNRERALLTEILVLLFRFMEGYRPSYSNVHKVEAVIGYMAKHFDEDVTLQRLAGYARLSESYLGRIFKSVTGRSPIDYLIDIRINHAKNLLHYGLSVSEISRIVGFRDIYYFSRAFKKREGISPSAIAAL